MHKLITLHFLLRGFKIKHRSSYLVTTFHVSSFHSLRQKKNQENLRYGRKYRFSCEIKFYSSGGCSCLKYDERFKTWNNEELITYLLTYIIHTERGIELTSISTAQHSFYFLFIIETDSRKLQEIFLLQIKWFVVLGHSNFPRNFLLKVFWFFAY